MATAVILLLIQLLLHMSTVNGAGQEEFVSDIRPNSVWITEPPETGIFVSGKPYTLKCHSSIPNAKYLWMYNNRILDLVNDVRRQLHSNGSLVFKKASNKRMGDAGTYRCIVQTPNDGDVSSKSVTLQAAVLPNFDESPTNITVRSEANRSVIRLSCHVNSIPEATISWEKDGDPLDINDKRFITQVPGVLYIKNVDDSDAGKYKCVAFNHLLKKTIFSEVGHVNVEKINAEFLPNSQPFTFILPSPLITNVKSVIKGDNVTFECAATGFPSPQLNWSFTALENTHSTKIGSKETSVNILTLTSVNPNDSGTYTCHVFQSITRWNDLPHKQFFRLEVTTPPSIVTGPASRNIPIANTVRFKCDVDGNPTPNITWYHNGQRLKSHGRMKIKDEQILIVSNTVSNDSGIYQCFASNMYGTSWAGALLTINSSPFEPAPPINISCKTLSSTEIQVSWQKSPTDISGDPPIIVRDSIQLNPSHSGDSSSSSAAVTRNAYNKPLSAAYSVHYMPTDGGQESSEVSVEHSFVIGKLKPYQNYTFYVRVYNGKSGSDQSEKVTCKTHDEAPQTVPNLFIHILSPISIYLEWSEVNSSLLKGVVTQYQVIWRQFESASNYVQTLNKNARLYTITGLKPGGKYQVQVLGVTQNVLTNIDFSWNLVHLPVVDPSLPVPILTFSVNQSIMLSWSANEQLVFSHYKLMYHLVNQANQTKMNEFEIPPGINSHIINYTSNLDIYEVLLNCVFKGRHGESVSRTIAVDSEILSPPSQIEAVATSPHTLNLSWVSPTDISDLSSLQFIITYHPVSNFTQNSTTVFTDLGATSFELLELMSYSLYEIKVSVQDKNERKSEFSQKIQIRTLQGVPGMVEQIVWHWINNSTVRITWVEPSKSNGVIIGYFVSYTYDLNIPSKMWQQINVPRHQTSLDLYELGNNTHIYFMVRAATNAGFGESGIYTIKSLAPEVDQSFNSDQPTVPPILYMKDEQLLGIVIGCVIGVCFILICTTSIVLKRQCMTTERVRNTQNNSLNSNMEYCIQNQQPFIVDNIQHEESVLLNDVSYITRHVDGRGRYTNDISGMEMPLLVRSNVVDHDMTNIHIIENPQCTVDVDGYDVDSLLSESAEGGAGTEESGCSDQLAKSQKCGDSSVVDDGFHEHVELNKMLVE